MIKINKNPNQNSNFKYKVSKTFRGRHVTYSFYTNSKLEIIKRILLRIW